MNSQGPSTVTTANHLAERRAWLRSMHISARSIRRYGLDNPKMSDLAWHALAREVIRYAGTMRKGHTKRKGDKHANTRTSDK